MKKLLLIAVMLMICVGITYGAQVNVPTSIQKFVATNFPSAKIVKVEQDHEYNGIEYEIKLDNGAKIDFDVSNQWEKIDCEKAPVSVPVNAVPKTIVGYVTKSYPKQYIVEIEKDAYGYEVKLSGSIELVFDVAGQFIRIEQ